MKPLDHNTFFFVSDLHGRERSYRTLFSAIMHDMPRAVLMGGDLLPSGLRPAGSGEFMDDFLAPELSKLKEAMKIDFPPIFVILGNDDARSAEVGVLRLERKKLWTYVHDKKKAFLDYRIYGYACVPPTPFALKDWERYDVSRFIDPGALAPEEGRLTAAVGEQEIRDRTIQGDLEKLAGDDALDRAILLFHAPPYQGSLDRAALDGRFFDHAPLDVHVGSIAIRRFIAERQPLVTLHGHVHESARLTGAWQETIGRTHSFSAAHDGPELVIVAFDPARPEGATRRLL